jgi:hypothetical protein
MSSDPTLLKVDLFLVLGFGVGLYLFVQGLRIFREYHVLIDTPEAPISGVAMGLVGIHGQAKIEKPVASPVTRTPCCFYKVDISVYKSGKSGGSYIHVATDCDGPKFYLQDESGKVLVDAHLAEYDLPETGKVVAQRDQPPEGEPDGKRQRRSHRTSGPSAIGARVLPTHDLWQYAWDAVIRSKAGAGALGHRYLLIESLILPDHWYDLTGTCVENPTPQDANDRNMIKKGTEEPTFLITWRGEREIRQMLRHRAVKYVFGGAILAVACLGIFLAAYGWLS